MLPYVYRLAKVIELASPSDGGTALAFAQQGVDYALGVLRVAHGDHSQGAQQSMPSIAEGVSWLRRADKLRPDIQTLDKEWWFWFKRRREPFADLDLGRSWNGEVRGSGPPEPALGGSQQTDVEASPVVAAKAHEPVNVASDDPRVRALLRANPVNWIIVRDRIGDLLPLVTRGSPIWQAFELEVDKFAKTSPALTRWAADPANARTVLAGLSGGYGVGRLALGTVDTTLDGAEHLSSAGIESVASAMRFKEVVGCSKEPSALAAAVRAVSAEEAAERRRDPVGRVGVESYERGFLIAVAEEVLLGDPAERSVAASPTSADSAAEASSQETPAEILTASGPALLEAYGTARSTNKPLDSLFAAIDSTIDAGHLALVREFALGEHDDVYGEGAGYQATAPMLAAFDELTEHTQMPDAKQARWLAMNIVDLAEEIGSDPLLTDLFLWTMHHNVDEHGATLITNASVVLIANARSAKTTTGSKVKIDQAAHVLRLLSKKAHQSGTEHQEMWCTAIANVIAKETK